MRGVEVEIHPGIRLRYAVDGEFKSPAPVTPRFADGLWQHTCFEVFVARPGMPGYHEFNLSPSGEWAAYVFDGYRTGMARLDVKPTIRMNDKTLEAAIPVDAGPLRIGLSAVIEAEGGALSYWALAHPPGSPDFHHRDGFALELA